MILVHGGEIMDNNSEVNTNIGSDSILTSIKAQLGIFSEEIGFDNDLILNINSVFSTLYQLGVGPDNGFTITDASSTWTEYLSNEVALDMVKAYMYLKVRMLFDPPSNSSYMNSVNEMIKEYEWRLNVFGHDNLEDEVNEEDS